jgi:hypothetical protein
MNPFDFLIIYLTCGAPLSVFYFLQYREQQNQIHLWLKTFSTFIFWIPFGFHLLKNKTDKKFLAYKKIFSESKNTQTKISIFRKQLEAIFQKSDLQISIFELREVFDRYVGLTLATNCEKTKTIEKEKEIFRIANSGNAEIGAICLNRRNLKRLSFHQTQARQDFFQIIKQLVKFASDKEEFVKSATGFFQLLKDEEANSEFGKAYSDSFQSKENFIADRSENFLWNTETRKQPPDKSPTAQMQTLSATAILSSKD